MGLDLKERFSHAQNCICNPLLCSYTIILEIVAKYLYALEDYENLMHNYVCASY